VTRTRDLLHKALKLRRVLAERDYRRGLLRGVAATVEHERIVFPRDYRSIVDVGANRGQFALFALHRFPTASLICFEPIPAARAKLAAVIGQNGRVRIHECAVGAEVGRVSLNIARSDDSSSLLRPTALQQRTFRNTETVSSTEVDVVTLDEIIDFEQLTLPFLLKIDVQGFELEVIKGAEQFLRHDGDVLVEASFVELYGGQALVDEVVAAMLRFEYRLRGILSITEGPDGMPLQGDLLFSRASASA
jgi:FkbM family methyltransferase